MSDLFTEYWQQMPPGGKNIHSYCQGQWQN